jgi:hypothetical protein
MVKSSYVLFVLGDFVGKFWKHSKFGWQQNFPKGVFGWAMTFEKVVVSCGLWKTHSCGKSTGPFG